MAFIDDFLAAGAWIMERLFTPIAIGLALWLRDQLKLGILQGYHLFAALLSGRRYVLVWNDHDKALSDKLGASLTLPPGLRALSLASPAQLANFPLRRRYVACVVLLVMDVTKLSDVERRRDAIQKRILAFVSSGGALVGSHDLIYRRTRNSKLQKAFGCQLDQFERTPMGADRNYLPVDYERNPAQVAHPIVASLPPELQQQFQLSDTEVEWGNWSPAAVPLFFQKGHPDRPLVVAVEHGRGRLVWLNSGDKANHPPRSLAEPQEPLVRILATSITWAAR